MSKREITVLTDVSLITCIVQRGIADTIVKAAQEAGAQGATVYYARGEGVRERLGILALAVEVDKEVINVVVAKDQADRILEDRKPLLAIPNRHGNAGKYLDAARQVLGVYAGCPAADTDGPLLGPNPRRVVAGRDQAASRIE